MSLKDGMFGKCCSERFKPLHLDQGQQWGPVLRMEDQRGRARGFLDSGDLGATRVSRLGSDWWLVNLSRSPWR